MPFITETQMAAPFEAGLASLERMRREMYRLFEESGRGFSGFPTRWTMPEVEPFWRNMGGAEPVVDLVERVDRYEVKVELPDLNEKNVEVKQSNGT